MKGPHVQLLAFVRGAAAPAGIGKGIGVGIDPGLFLEVDPDPDPGLVLFRGIDPVNRGMDPHWG